jgi:hypothetical protein
MIYFYPITLSTTCLQISEKHDDNPLNPKGDAVKKALTLTIITVALIITPRQASAQFAVYDAANYQRQLMNWLQAHQQVVTAIKDFETAAQTYQLLDMMSQRMRNMATRYATAWAPWRYGVARDIYGNTGGWITGINTGLPPTVLNGYQNATNALQTYRPSDLSSMDPAVRQQVESGYGTVELADGANQDAMETIGAIRGNAANATSAIANIQADSLSDDPTLNTEVSVLNKVNATNVLALQNAQDTNKLLVALLEQQTIAAKRLRDADTEAIDDDIYRRANVVPMNSQLSGSFGSQLANYRLP